MSPTLSARARVLATYPDGRVELLLDQGTACPGCQCAHVWSAGRRRIVVELDPIHEIEPGSSIDLRVAAADVLETSMWVHGLPWLLLVTGAACGAIIGHGDVATLFAAAFGFLAGLVLLKRRARRYASPKIAVMPNR